jgi:hypothetical protein
MSDDNSTAAVKTFLKQIKKMSDDNSTAAVKTFLKQIKKMSDDNSTAAVKMFLKQIIKTEHSRKRQTKGIIYLASVLNNIRCN